MKYIFSLIQCTWGAGQTVMGLFFFLLNIKRPHRFYRGCIETQWDAEKGLSLGLFIFTPLDKYENAAPIRVHEYGHAVQSALLGPLYAFVGVISTTWGMLPCFQKLRAEKHVPYTACFVEAWASKWGELVTKEPAVWF